MSVETQLRELAEAASAEQRPVTAEEAIAHTAHADFLDDQSPRRGWALVAATIALLIGGLVVLLAWDRTPDDEPPPIVSIPETIPLETTVPATSAPATVPETSTTTTSVPTVGPVPEGASGEALVNEPTLGYRDGVEWWVPLRLPDGWRYGYAVDDGQVQTIRLLAQDRSMIDVEFGADAATIGEVAVGAVSEDLGGEPWQVADDDGAGVAARELDGRLLVVRGPIEPVRSVAASLVLVPETRLVRPPFHADGEPGPVVLTLAADEVGGGEPFELRAHTDGLFTTVGGEIKQVSPDDPLAFGNYVYELTGDAESYRVVVTGVALAGAEQITFGLLDGSGPEVTATDSDRFTEDFYAFVIDVPASVLEQYEQGGLERLTRWSFAWVDGRQRVYDEPASENCVNCGEQTVGIDEIDPNGSLSGATSEEAPPLVFDPTTSVVVARISGVTNADGVPTELRASSDGVSVFLGTPGSRSRVAPDQPVIFGGGSSPTPPPGADTAVFVVWGITLPEVATLEFEQLNGEVLTVVPEDLSGHFGIGFFLVAVEVPGGGADPYANYASVVPSVTARDASGRVVTTISEPF